MSEIKPLIIICENCFNIPKIFIITKDKVKIECQKCNSSIIKDFSYFDKFIKRSEDENLVDLPKCSYNQEHESKSMKYCLQCTKYLCDKCIEIHNISFNKSQHLLIDQKFENQYYCNKDGHKEYIFNRYCTECKLYLCPQCKCEHKNENIYYFDNSSNKQKIKEIINKVKKCKEIVEAEEKKLNTFLEEHIIK